MTAVLQPEVLAHRALRNAQVGIVYPGHGGGEVRGGERPRRELG